MFSSNQIKVVHVAFSEVSRGETERKRMGEKKKEAKDVKL